MTKRDAIAKWSHLEDTHFWLLPETKFFLAVKLAGVSEQDLIEFWRDVKDLSFPETYGASPWDRVSPLAFALHEESKGIHFTARSKERVSEFRNA